jgi:hypothetical protein
VKLASETQGPGGGWWEAALEGNGMDRTELWSLFGRSGVGFAFEANGRASEGRQRSVTRIQYIQYSYLS